MSPPLAPLQLPPLSLYVHIPWCAKKCPYCDFNSHTIAAIPETQYVQALLEDLEQELAFVQGRPLQSIFFGGGTPSLFSAQAIAAILQGVEKRIRFAADIEITLEANPGSAERQKFADYYLAGVNRLSIGVQSFNDQQLSKLGRIHNHSDAIEAACAAQAAGFNNFNIDLMHGLPQQSLDDSLADLQQAIDSGASHISWYQLTIEPNTVFFTSPPTLPADDLLADIQQAGEEFLAGQQLQQYEVSAYCRNQQTAKHNVNYWLFGDYIGIGAGAHGKLTSLSKQSIQRRWKTRAPKDYLASGGTAVAGSRELQVDELPLEFMMNSLRLNQGFDQQLFSQRTGLELSSIAATLASLSDRGLLDVGGPHIAPTALGRRFLNDILAEF